MVTGADRLITVSLFSFFPHLGREKLLGATNSSNISNLKNHRLLWWVEWIIVCLKTSFTILPDNLFLLRTRLKFWKFIRWFGWNSRKMIKTIISFQINNTQAERSVSSDNISCIDNLLENLKNSYNGLTLGEWIVKFWVQRPLNGKLSFY